MASEASALPRCSDAHSSLSEPLSAGLDEGSSLTICYTTAKVTLCVGCECVCENVVCSDTPYEGVCVCVCIYCSVCLPVHITTSCVWCRCECVGVCVSLHIVHAYRVSCTLTAMCVHTIHMHADLQLVESLLQ